MHVNHKSYMESCAHGLQVVCVEYIPNFTPTIKCRISE